MSIRCSKVVNRSAAVMSRSESVDESCRNRRSIVRHRIDAKYSFFSIATHLGAPLYYHMARIGMNRGESWPET